MRAFVSIMVVAGLCCLFPIDAHAAGNATAKEVLHEWAVALSGGSVDKMVAFYEDSKDVLAIQSTGRVRKGAAEIRKEYEAAFAEVVFEKATLANLTVRQSGDQKRLLGLVEARQKIYIPAYEWMLENRVEPVVFDEIIGRAFRGIPQFFHDKEDNGSIHKDAPLAHASVLVQYVNKRIEERLGHRR